MVRRSRGAIILFLAKKNLSSPSPRRFSTLVKDSALCVTIVHCETEKETKQGFTNSSSKFSFIKEIKRRVPLFLFRFLTPVEISLRPHSLDLENVFVGDYSSLPQSIGEKHRCTLSLSVRTVVAEIGPLLPYLQYAYKVPGCVCTRHQTA